MVNSGKKGQAAMEFLMTYGWALLVVLVSIGALAFFGVLNPSKLTPEQCNLGPGFACADYKIDSASGTLFLDVQNGLGKNLDLLLVHINKKNLASTATEPCGGKFAFVAGTSTVPGYNPNKVPVTLNDGAKAPVKHTPAFASDPVNGLNCNSFQPTVCCTVAHFGFINPLTGLPIQPICDLTTVCSSDASLFLTKGKKYSFDLVITYKESESALIHQRTGSLSAVAE